MAVETKVMKLTAAGTVPDSHGIPSGRHGGRPLANTPTKIRVSARNGNNGAKISRKSLRGLPGFLYKYEGVCIIMLMAKVPSDCPSCCWLLAEDAENFVESRKQVVILCGRKPTLDR